MLHRQQSTKSNSKKTATGVTAMVAKGGSKETAVVVMVAAQTNQL